MVHQHSYSQETRQFPRVVFRKTPWFFSLLLDDYRNLLDSPIQIEALNISLGGLRFQSNKKIPIFSLVKIQLVHKDGTNKHLLIQGKVVRVDETDLGLSEKIFGMSVEFTTMSEDVKHELIVGITLASS